MRTSEISWSTVAWRPLLGAPTQAADNLSDALQDHSCHEGVPG